MSAANPYDPANTVMRAHGGPYMLRRLHIRKIDPLSTGKILGLIYALIALVVGLFLTMIAVFGVAAGGGGGNSVVGGLITGVGAVLLLPLFNGLMGFVGGAIAALLYNLVASMAGGIVFEVED